MDFFETNDIRLNVDLALSTLRDVDAVNSAILSFGKTKVIIATTAFSRIPSHSGLFGNNGYVLIE